MRLGTTLLTTAICTPFQAPASAQVPAPAQAPAPTPASIPTSTQAPTYRNPDLPVSLRVADLLARMTLEEKLLEITGGNTAGLLDESGKEFKTPDDPFANQSSPTATTSPRRLAILRNAAQRYQREKTRLGIPWLFRGEALHGYMAHHATCFPMVPALASTWDPALVRQVFTAASDEMSSVGVRHAFTPVLDLARDPRWGRTEELYGEDPYLVSRMGVAAIQGLQGPDLTPDGRFAKHRVLATAKHFAAHGQPETGTNTAPANISERVLRETFLAPFQAAVQEAHVGCIMASYNEIDGIPAHINPWLLQRILRQEWGFQGSVISDGDGIQMLVNWHRVAGTIADAARLSLEAGIDYDLSDGKPFRTLADQVKQGKVSMAQVDRAVSHMLTAKFRLGLFEDPFVDPEYAERITGGPEHRALALRAAEKGIVLLKNQDRTLPLDLNRVKTLAVIGPNAADVHTGGYSRQPAHGVSLLQGIRDRVGSRAKVLYAEGCKLTLGVQGWMGWIEDHTPIADPKAQEPSIRQAVETARKADVVILALGETESTNREAWAQNHLGDRASLDLIGAQEELLRRIVETGKPVVVFLLNGRALSINSAAEHARAIVEGWYLGQEGGTAAASVLFGDVNPGGKLPVTFPKSVGQLPIYYNHKPSTRRDYIGLTREPLFPFGFGMSYTTFEFKNLRVEPAKIGPGGSAWVSVEITNTGAREGDEVPQMYLHQRIASVTRPVQELRGFQRISLKAGETRTVTFPITPDALALWNAEMRRVVEPGIFEIMVGPSSAQTQTVNLEVVRP